MSHDRWDQMISDYIDGLLQGEEAEAVRRHVASCAECAATLQDYVAIQELARSHRAPRPSSDPWPRIEVEVIRRRRRQPLMRVAMGLAASLVLLGGTLVLSGRGPQPTTEPSVAPPIAGTAVAVDRTPLDDQSFALRVQELEELYEQATDRLDPRTAEVVRESLREIDAALRRATEALAADPSNQLLRALLERSRAQKLDLLTDVNSSL